MALSRLDIKNMALGEVPATRIEAEDETSLEAQETEAAYAPALAYLLEFHEWDFAVMRATLAAITNDRAHEWTYAYRLPTDVATPRLILPFGAADIAGGVPDYSTVGRMRAFEAITPYRISGTTLYANREGAILEYVSDAPDVSRFTAKFARALALEIASRIVMPLKKDRVRQGDLIKAAEVARERARAEDMNRDRESVHDFVPEGQLARMGLLPWQL